MCAEGERREHEAHRHAAALSHLSLHIYISRPVSRLSQISVSVYSNIRKHFSFSFRRLFFVEKHARKHTTRAQMTLLRVRPRFGYNDTVLSSQYLTP